MANPLALILLTALLVLLFFFAFGFTGCSSLAEVDPWPDGERPDQPEGPKYADIVKETPGFAAHWGMNETAGATEAAVDGLPNLNAVYVGGVVPGSPGAFVQKDPGNFAASLDGATAYLEVPFSPQLNLVNGLPFSVEVWVKPAAALPEGVEQILISSHHISAGGNHRGYEIAMIGTSGPHATVRGRVFSIDAPFVSNVDITPTDGDDVAWRHIVLTHNGGGMAGDVLKLYVSVEGVAGTLINEEPDAQYREVQAGGAGERPLRFGAGHLQEDGPEKFFAGLIDEVAFYQTALGDTDVELHFQALQ
jgi:hypothetical protein